MKNLVLVAAAAATLAGCASSSDKIEPIYVSAMKYNSYSCRQIETEARIIADRAGAVAGVQDKNAQNDAAATAAAIILFWPAAFLVKGDNQNAEELARLRGELDALQRASEAKHCGLVFQQRDTGAE